MSGISYPSLLKYLVVADFKTDVNRYFLGFFWWFAEPLMYVAVFYLAFSHLRSGDENYIYFLIVGITVWRWLASSINNASNSIVSKKRIIGHFSLNPVVFTLSTLVTNVLKFVVLMAFVTVLLWQTDKLQFAGIEPLLLWSASTFLCVLAVSLVAAFLVVYIPDMRIFISQGLMLLMFLSGVIFSMDNISGEIANILQLNPFLHLISSVRYLLMGPSQGSFPADILWLILLCSAMVCLIMTIVSARLSTDIPKRVLL